ncbi:MAG: PQQ-binding-like beta-propeller repeat protein [Abditibacteriales bacterium]|nr:PQQ-binding-like beta-propeller repeat protein [Abditibacteriales bacterium]MDW8364381.1 PQQ-binding-like beta-propeller repeat protein [Abditibacteriales bacterium]
MRRILSLLSLVLCVTAARADWTTLRGNAQRTGYVPAVLRPPFRVVWVRHFVGERMSSAVEPIVADGKLFAATHSGNVYALDARTGEPLWRFQARGAFLHAPALGDGVVVAANVDGGLYALDAATGKVRWSVFVGRGGFSASPTVADGAVFIGARTGEFLVVELKSGKVRWQQRFDAPIRQTAAFDDGRVFVTPEDLRVRCLEARTGKILWTSAPLIGQTARDYYPVIAKDGARPLVILRTNPVINMAQRLAQDRHWLCQNAGVDDSDWRKVEAWTRSEAARGKREQWAQEQTAIVRYLNDRPAARTLFVLDAGTGKEAGTAPVLWVGGCQGVGTPPVVTPDRRLFVFYRSAFGNWNYGVAPLVALGFLDAENFIHPVHHKHGMQPPWNTFWGTADESQNFVVAGDTVLIVHQGTLSGFDLNTQQLFLIAGDRDSWGGFRNLPWARNEWHGPARGGVAVVGSHIYWQTGSRILCIVAGEPGKAAEDTPIDAVKIRATTAQSPPAPAPGKTLADAVTELLSRRWAPLFVEPGLAGREFFFDDSGEVFEALAWAYPHLPNDVQKRVKAFLADEWQQHPPFAKEAWYALNAGERRERFWVPPDVLSRLGHDQPHHPLGNLYAVWLYAERCGEWERVRADWRGLRACFDDFVKTNWRLNPERGDLFANRYLASLRALVRLAEKAGDAEAAAQAKAMAEQTAEALVAWWQRSAEQVRLPVIQNIAEWDRFIGSGDALFFKVIPHKAKVALFHDLTPEVAAVVTARAPGAVDKLWRAFETLCPTWHLVGEERQVHYGENFLDPPDFALDAFKALAWLRGAKANELEHRLDVPFCRADLSYVAKLSIIQSKGEREG